MKRLYALILAIVMAWTCMGALADVKVDKQTVKQVQQALNDAGYNCGTPDGMAGKKTHTAISDFQAANGLSVTGEIDEALLTALGIDFDRDEPAEQPAEQPAEAAPKAEETTAAEAAPAEAEEEEVIPDFPENDPSIFVIKSHRLVGYKGTEANVVIPKGVTSVDGWIFSRDEDFNYYDNTTLRNVVFPDGVKDAGQALFYNCYALEHVYNMPKGMKELGYQFFCNCEKLEGVRLPDGITSFDDNVFSHCYSLKSLKLPPNLTEIGRAAFYYCTSLTELVLPATVTSIDESAFEGCSALTEMVIPKGVSIIKENTFEDCTGLKSVTIPAGVTEISRAAFRDCDSLTDVSLPASVAKLGEFAFYGCEALTSIALPRAMDRVPSHAFGDCSSLTNVTLPNTITSIGEGAFSGCLSLERIAIPTSVTSIADDAFGELLDEYYSVEIKNRLTIVGESGSYAEQYAQKMGVNFEIYESKALTSGLSLETETHYTVYESQEVLGLLGQMSAAMRTVETAPGEDILRCGFAAAEADRMVSGFSVEEPSVTKAAALEQLYDLPETANWLLFDMYDFQRHGLDKYINAAPLDLERLGAYMHDYWRTPKGFDFAAGMTSDGITTWYWEPIYFETDKGGLQEDTLYLMIYAVAEGADEALLDQLKVYYPVLGEYRVEKLIISDTASICALLDAMIQETNLNPVDSDAMDGYWTMKQGDSGNEVKSLQRRLYELGFMTSSVDGYYGPMTEDAVKAYQAAQGLTKTGEADPTTQWMLYAEQKERDVLIDWLQRQA